MGRSYYYFAATLPVLLWGHKPAITVEQFLDDARRLLTEEDFAFLEALLQEGGHEIPAGDALLTEIVKFNQSYHNLLAAFRAQRAGKDPADHVRGEQYQNPYLADALQRASKENNLLAAEEILHETKWQLLEDLVVGHQQDIAFLCVYGLRLKMAQRHAEVNSQKGAKIFDKYEMFQLTGEDYMSLPEHRSR